MLAWVVAAVGALAAFDAVFPSIGARSSPASTRRTSTGSRRHSSRRSPPRSSSAARGLARGNRRAWQVAVCLLTALLVLHVERRFDEGAIVTGIAVVALVARRGDFGRRGDPDSKPRVLVHAALAAVAVVVYGLVTLWVNRLMADQPYSISFALRVTGRALAGLSLPAPTT